MDRLRNHKFADATAIGTSMLCLVHCLLLPVALALFPALGGLAGIPEAAHLLLFAAAVPISSLAVISGYRLHGALLPSAIALVGLSLVGVGALGGFPWLLETSVTVAGSLVLALAHIFNWRFAARPERRSPNGRSQC